MDDAQPLDAAEAEAVLLALGPQLEWRRSGEVDTRKQEVAKARFGHYWIRWEPRTAPLNNTTSGNAIDRIVPPDKPVRISHISGLKDGVGTDRHDSRIFLPPKPPANVTTQPEDGSESDGRCRTFERC